MSTSKKLASVAVAVLTGALGLGLPAPYGGIVGALLAAASYVADHDALFGSKS